MTNKASAGTKVRRRIHIATLAALVFMLAYTCSVIYVQLQTIERGAQTEARNLARSVAYGTAFTGDPQAYVEGLDELYRRDIVILDIQKKGLADADPSEVGMTYDHDPGNEVSLTISDGKARTFVEQSKGHTDGLKQMVVPVFAQNGAGAAPTGAVVLEYTGIRQELIDAAIVHIYMLGVAGAFCALATGMLGFQLGNAVKASAQKIHHLAFHDELTGLSNRAMFSSALNKGLTVAKDQSSVIAVLFLDLDRFKNINDTLGHTAGDLLLKEVATRITSCLHAGDSVARLGGDEFVVLVYGPSNTDSLRQLARKALAAVAQPFNTHGHEFRVTASIGIAVYPEDGEDEQLLMRNADIAMYQAKQDGKNGFAFYSAAMNQHSIERLAFEASFRHAVDRMQFRIHYQPKIDSRTERIEGVEALLRWDDPDLGSVSPVKFIPVAEETGLIVPLGRWVLRSACEQQVAWAKQGLRPISMAVNLSPRQFADEGLLDDVRSIVAKTGIAPGYLELEITEGMLIQEAGQAVKLLEALRGLGIRLAVDDFGTGYSSLSNLKRFPVDTIKVDRSFIRDLPDNSEDRAITEAIIAMGRSLSLNVVAEGVETSEQANFLREHGCDQFQGFYFSKAVTSVEIIRLLKDQEIKEGKSGHPSWV
ncbi:EAL domain-containing protein [Variovorax sp. RTB1]|uniref:putative bifunctional diguanylate cyclase/phosphodiesterase n=1 Tax=Variovorax sp. RTB1 TaxID=3048631 RepID=UPI002B222E22|nr:EAL domain-containing protein [Variovorax sp. RTB1]MEB0110896.1 EAL domain-containing protein [Variovorax sp. RTB1]